MEFFFPYKKFNNSNKRKNPKSFTGIFIYHPDLEIDNHVTPVSGEAKQNRMLI